MESDVNIIEKIRKCFALGASANEAEAAVAMSMGAELMAKHNITQAQVDAHVKAMDDIVFAQIDLDKQHEAIIARAAATLYGCVAVFDKPEDPTSVSFFGNETQLQACGLTYASLVEQVEQLYQTHRPSSKNGAVSRSERRDYRRNFRNTCAMRLLVKANEIVGTLAAKGVLALTCNALVPVDARVAAIEAGLQGVQKASTALKIRETEGSVHGFMAAEDVKFHKEVK
jgi:hypothetical protein